MSDGDVVSVNQLFHVSCNDVEKKTPQKRRKFDVKNNPCKTGCRSRDLSAAVKNVQRSEDPREISFPSASSRSHVTRSSGRGVRRRERTTRLTRSGRTRMDFGTTDRRTEPYAQVFAAQTQCVSRTRNETTSKHVRGGNDISKRPGLLRLSPLSRLLFVSYFRRSLASSTRRIRRSILTLTPCVAHEARALLSTSRH